ncbi:MAG: sensor histidine kinase [Gemmatimonadaceae bacterium]
MTDWLPDLLSGDTSMTGRNTADDNSLRSQLAASIRANREEIVQRWLERISARVTLSDNEIFPTEHLLDHVPLLLDGIALYLQNPGDFIDGGPVTAKAMELGALRHSQGFDAYQILKEHDLLGRIIYSTLRPVAAELAEGKSPVEALEVWEEIGNAVQLIMQATLTHFLRLAADKVSNREAQLRRFNRMVSHELKNRVGAVRGAAHMLEEPWVGETERARFQRMIIENSAGVQQVLTSLEALSRLESDARQRSNVLLNQAAAEVVRQLRAAAESNGVEVRVGLLPSVEVDAAVVELCLTNFISNAIKYADSAKPDRWVQVDAELVYAANFAGELVVSVRDNGIGVPRESRDRLFQQFYRAHAESVTNVEGTGLGLSIARETAESLGGRAWAEFPDDGGSVFAFALPSRRVEDSAAAGTRRDETSITQGEP